MMEFSSLPIEIVATIFAKLDKANLLTCRLVNEDWKYVLDNFFFKAKVLLTNQSSRAVRYSQLNVETLRVRNFTRADLNRFMSARRAKGGPQFPDNGLQIHPKSLVFMRKASKTLTHASVTSENILKLLELNPNIEYLCFDFNTLVFNSLEGIVEIAAKTCQFQYLKHLKVSFNSNADERENLYHLSKVKFSALTTIQLFGRFQSTIEDSALVYLRFYEIVANQRDTLQVVNLVHPIRSTRREPADPMPVLPVDGAILEDLRNKLMEVQANGIYINFDQDEGIFPGFDLGFRLLQNQRALTHLHVTFRDNMQMTIFPIKELIENNSKTLLCLDIINNRRGSPLVNITNLGSMDSLGSCHQLTTLRLVNLKIPRFSNQFHLKLPPTITSLLLWGSLGSLEILEKIQLDLPELQKLEFFNLDGNQVGNELLAQKLKRMLDVQNGGLKDLCDVYWHKRNFKFDFLRDLPGIIVKPFSISTAWSWPLRKSVLTEAYRITRDSTTNP